jgi:signal peptidase
VFSPSFGLISIGYKQKLAQHMSTAHRIFSIFNGLVWTVVACFVLLLILTSVSQLSLPALSYQAFVIISGSMEPTIMTGDLIFAKKEAAYALTDVITYQTPGDPLITHRIIGVDPEDATRFITQGDNNEDPDPVTLASSEIKGKFAFRLPSMGYALVYSKTPIGLLLLVGLPIALMLIEAAFFSKKLVAATNTNSTKAVSSSTQSSVSPDVS